MKKNSHIKNAIRGFVLLGLSCCLFMTACNKEVDVVASKNGSFSANVAGTSMTGAELLDFSYITNNDEFLESPYAEIHLAGTNAVIDISLVNPAAKLYPLAGTNAEAGVVLNVNGIMYEGTTASQFIITEATSSKISGTISGTFKNVSSAATVQITNGSFTAQF